mmetsp:Transcript_81063/g.208669  ORF Transcript_81063/g.208669 Transcript_81063/m.208669 type:complete len:97 (+) Transcript_81063:1474-1764(+)
MLEVAARILGVRTDLRKRGIAQQALAVSEADHARRSTLGHLVLDDIDHALAHVRHVGLGGANVNADDRRLCHHCCAESELPCRCCSNRPGCASGGS